MIFAEKERHELDASSYSEPIYTYLNRSARTSSEKVRNFLEAWLLNYPQNEINELLPRLQSPDDNVLLSGFFELFIFNLLCEFGYAITLHPRMKSEVSKKPDFLVENENEEFVLEAVNTQEYTKEEKNGQIFINSAFDKIDEIQSKDFFIHVNVRGVAEKPIKSRNLKIDIQDWLKTLNYDELSLLYKSKGLDGMPHKKFTFDGVKLKISPIPKNLNRGQFSRLLGSQMYGFRAINAKNAIKKAIKGKSSRYGIIDKPFILAINCLSMVCDNDDVMDALFGTEQYVFDLDSSQSVPPRMQRANDGMWTRKKGTRLSGILLFKSLTPWTIAHQNATLFLNPWAEFPYKGDLLDLNHAKADSNNNYFWTKGVEFSDLFRLNNEWPEDKKPE
jgi:hypothetical protein